MARRAKRKKDKKRPEPGGKQKRRLRTQRILFTAFAILILASFIVGMIAQGF